MNFHIDIPDELTDAGTADQAAWRSRRPPA
jgi:hypothetical protein